MWERQVSILKRKVSNSWIYFEERERIYIHIVLIWMCNEDEKVFKSHISLPPQK
jgi:hypothetical protein